MRFRLHGCALPIALLGITGCLGEEELAAVDGVSDDDMESLDAFEQAPHEDEIGDPELAAAITAAKMAEIGPEGDSLRFASCGRNGPTDIAEFVSDASFPDAARQRSGSSTGCATDGVLQPTDDAIYFCWTRENATFTWTYLENVRTGVRGWTRDDLLWGNGAIFGCGF
jgi:hypothetical protein